MDVTIEVAGATHDLHLAKRKDGYDVQAGGETVAATLERNGTGVLVRVGGRTLHVELGPGGQARIDGKPAPYRLLSVTGTARVGGAARAHGTHVRPPMNGKLERILVAPGQVVAKGDVLFVLEAMKMHNEVKSPAAGKVTAVHLQAGATVEPRQVVLDLEPV